MSEEQAKYGEKKYTYREGADALLGNPATPYWLKEVIKALDEKEPDYAIEQVAILLKLQMRRAEEIKESARDEAKQPLSCQEKKD
jgi:hypothetical protein